ncbi:hypothetical protein RBB50_009174 [Rhinocladiella similis]
MSRDEFFRQWLDKDTDLDDDNQLQYIHSLLAFVESQEPLIADELNRLSGLCLSNVTWASINRPGIDLEAMAYIMQKEDEMPDDITRRWMRKTLVLD